MLAHFVLTEWDDSLPYQLGVNCAGFAAMIGTASVLSWYRKMDRAALRAKTPGAQGALGLAPTGRPERGSE